MAQQTVDGTGERLAPLSAAQEQLWFIDRLKPASATYNIPSALRIRGPLDVEAMRESIRRIVLRHEILRTVFPVREGHPVQRIKPSAPDLLDLVDFTTHPDAERWAAVERRIDQEVRRPFDLTNGPLLRTLLLRTEPDHHVLLFVFHHIVFDGASQAILFRELGEFYGSLTKGRLPALPALRTQYAQYAQWQRRQSNDEGLAYWKAKLAGAPQKSQLATDRPRPVLQSDNGVGLRFDMDHDLYQKVLAFSKENGATPFATLLTAFQVLVARYTKQQDIVIGVPVGARLQESLDELIGYFVNTLPLRVEVRDESSFLNLVQEVQETLWEGMERSDVPFDEIVRLIQPERDASFTPLVQVTCGMLTDKVLGTPALPGLEVESHAVEAFQSKFDISLDLHETDDGISGQLEYNVDLFDEASMQRLADHWLTLLTAAVTEPGRPLSALPLLTGPERERILVDWNRTESDFADPSCLHALFETSVRKAPESVAVVMGDKRVTYGDLDRRINQLAHALRNRGVGPETNVGICLERSVDSVTAMLAVLKAGGAFVAMDPELPRERLAFMMTDSKATLLLTKTSLGLSLSAGTTCLQLDGDGDEIAMYPTDAPHSAVNPAQLACLIYTSGSTGTPKCAMLTHSNFVNYYHFFNDRYRLDRVLKAHLQMSNFAFDLFIADTMRALFTGATLVLCPRDVVLSPPDLYRLMVREGINSAEFIPPVLKALLDHVEEEHLRLDFMDLLMAGGDNWYVRDYLRARRLTAPTTRLIGTYGLTEAAIDNSHFEIGEVQDDPDGVVPIGRPLANTQLYILSSGLEPVPVGVPGELYIGGRGVGRGYLGRPALTAERYIPDPFGSEPGARLYKTGDLTRYRPDGTIEILGRVDTQVKLRGFRIELGEIEAALRGHPLVDDAVALVREAASGERHLVAYITTQEKETAAGDTIASLREHLSGRLPAFMVPTAFVLLDAMPLNTNAKVDRLALPAPSEEQLLGTEERSTHRSPVEEITAGIWCEVLGLSRIGTHDNFFSAGGHSLLLTRVASRIRNHFGVDVPLKELYQHPTVSGLAQRVEELLRAGRGFTSPAMSEVTRHEGATYEASFAQQQMWFQNEIDPGNTTYNVPLALRLHGELDTGALEYSLTALVERHEVLHTGLVARRGIPVQFVYPAHHVAIRTIDLSELAPDAREQEVARLLQEDDARPFDLSHGPLLRASLLRLEPEEHVLLLILHHMATDGWSTSILLKELGALYTAKARGQAPRLADLPAQYIEFAQWQRRHMRGEVLRQQLDYWRNQLVSAPALIDLPFDRPRSAVGSHDGGLLRLTVPETLLTQARQLSNAEGATLFMTLLAAFQAFLSRCTGQSDIVVGIPTANRTKVEAEPLLGCFVNMLALRTDLSQQPTFRELLREVRDTALGAYAHEDVPFEKVVEALRPVRSTWHNPIFQVVLAFQNAPDEVLELPGVSIEEVPVNVSTSKFDLSLDMAETPTGLKCQFVYKKDLFDESTVYRLAGQWQTLLRQVVTDPDTSIGELAQG